MTFTEGQFSYLRSGVAISTFLLCGRCRFRPYCGRMAARLKIKLCSVHTAEIKTLLYFDPRRKKIRAFNQEGSWAKFFFLPGEKTTAFSPGAFIRHCNTLLWFFSDSAKSFHKGHLLPIQVCTGIQGLAYIFFFSDLLNVGKHCFKLG